MPALIIIIAIIVIVAIFSSRNKNNPHKEIIEQRKNFVATLSPTARIIVNNGTHLFFMDDAKQVFGVDDSGTTYSYAGIKCLSAGNTYVHISHEKTSWSGVELGKSNTSKEGAVPIDKASISSIINAILPIARKNVHAKLKDAGVTPTHEYVNRGELWGCDINSRKFYFTYGFLNICDFSKLVKVEFDDYSSNPSYFGFNYRIFVTIKGDAGQDDEDFWINIDDRSTLDNLLAMFKGIKNRQGTPVASRQSYNTTTAQPYGSADNINGLSGVEFEHLCQRLVEKMGFSSQTTKASGDGGIDLIAFNYQPLLSGKYIIQCKRYAGSVGEPIIRDLYGVVTSERANKGILITTGHFTKSAIGFAENKPIELIDGAQLKVLIEQYLKSDSSFAMPAYHSQTSITSVSRSAPEVKTNTNNLPDYLFYSPNNVEFSEVQENPSFVPFGYEDKYRTVVSRMSANPGNLCDTGHMISLLQDYIYNDKSWLWGDISTNVLYRNKRDALLTVLNVSQNLRTNQYLYLLYLSISAQSHFMLGNWKEAIRYYEELLSQPGVLVDAVHKTMYSGELELAAKIIHNICLILAGAGKEDLAVAYRAKYEYIFDLELYRTERLISNNPHLKDRFEKDWKQLSDTSLIKDFYFDRTLMWGYDVDGDGMLGAINKDCENSGKIKSASLDEAKEIRFLNDNTIAVMDYETGGSDSRILVVQLRD